MKKRGISVFLTACLCMGLLSGCKTGENIEVSKQDLNIPDDKYRTFYEVFVYSFYDGNGDGVGDLKGLTEKLDYINDGDASTDTDLGCNGIWLMPIMPSPTYHKYDVTDFYAIDAEYGTMEDFEAFMAACKERDVHVIIDFVLNHTSSSHPWFVEACEYLKGLGDKEPSVQECPYYGYYNFTKEGGAGYSRLEGTEWYYEAQFWSGMPDLNVGNEAVRGEIEDIVDFWLAKGIDGFRLDAAKEYYSGTVDANIDFLSWFNSMVKEKKEDAYIVAEVWTDMDTYAQYYGSGIDSVFDFDFADSSGIIASVVKGSKPASGFGKALQTLDEKFSGYNPDYIDAPFYTNHDLGRSAGYYSGKDSERQTKIAGAMNLMMNGCCFLYYGEELGMKGAGRDENKRAPMYWSKDSQKEGMCDGPIDMEMVKMKYDSLEEQREDKWSIYNYYKEAIRLRNVYPEIARGKVSYIEGASDDNICVIKKVYESSEVLLVMNVSKDERKADLSGVTVNGKEIDGADSLEGLLLTGTEQIKMNGEEVTLPPYAVALFH
ncbi:MAG: alpha-amylase [Clostridiales bacterium]|nr:alpha-amylase [Clostridiales bacterium]